MKAIAIHAALMFASITAITGCKDSKKIYENNVASFSFAGVQIGMHKDSLKEGIGIQSCKAESATIAECFIGNDKTKQLSFFGVKTSSETVRLQEPYTNVSGITFYFDHSSLSKDKIEQAWGLGGRCLSGWEIDEIRRSAGSLALAVAVDGLGDIRVRPYNNSFICLEDTKFIEVSNYDGKGGAVHIYFLDDRIADLYEKVFHERDNLMKAKQRQEEVILGLSR